MRRLRVGIGQMNTIVGDFAGNAEKIVEIVSQSKALGVDLLTFPELATCGYPPEDLLFKPRFIEENLNCLEAVVKSSAGINIVVGFVDQHDGLYNAAAVIVDGKLAGVYHKIFLPNYGVFDEHRYFRPGGECSVFVIAGVSVGVTICEDIWFDAGPHVVQADSGAEVLVNISASPYHFGKSDKRTEMLQERARDNQSAVVYCNLVGGQDELVFDGNGLVLDHDGRLIAMGKQFEEDLVVADIDVNAIAEARRSNARRHKAALPPEAIHWRKRKVLISRFAYDVDKPTLPARSFQTKGSLAEVYDALVLGTRDYVLKNGFNMAAIGLSGGIDSSMVATIATDAIGPTNVIGVTMPSRYSSPGSVVDSESLALNLGIRLLNIPIETIFENYLETLEPHFGDTASGVAEENLQARIRGNLMMALSNKFGWLVLTTGNKSEMATGYATLYGDMAGGFAVIKDVTKTLVYQLCRYRNSLSASPIIPDSVMLKPPSAELRPNQRDIDSLPPYDILDPILIAYVEEDKDVRQIAKMGYSEDIVKRVAQLVDRSEYKRRQSPPGIKITPRAFGRDRRLPITNRFAG